MPPCRCLLSWQAGRYAGTAVSWRNLVGCGPGYGPTIVPGKRLAGGLAVVPGKGLAGGLCLLLPCGTPGYQYS